jgi:protein SMG5
MKKDSQLAREAIRWLENQFKQGNRFIRAQIQNEKISNNNRQQLLKSKDIDAWRFSQLIDCCKYFKQQFEVNKNDQHKDGITQMVTLLTNHNLHEIEINERLTNLIKMAYSEKIEVKNIKEFYDKWKSTV